MGYTKEIYNEVFAELAQQRQEAVHIAEQRRQELYKKVPQLQMIESTLSSFGVQMSKRLLSQPEQAGEIVAEFHKEAEALATQKEEILLQLNLSPDYLDPSYECLRCNDSGYVNGVACECLSRRLRDKAYERLNRLSNLRLCNFHNFDLELYPALKDERGFNPRERMRETFSYCMKYGETFTTKSRSILMIGNTGLGKTHLSLAIARSVIEKGFGVVYGSAPNLINAVEREKFSREGKGYEVLSSLLDCDLLILDDLGAEFQTQFTTSTIYNIINTRIIRELPTIINTNLTFKELEDVYSPRILSRLNSVYDHLHFFGNDVRPLLKYHRK